MNPASMQTILLKKAMKKPTTSNNNGQKQSKNALWYAYSVV